VKIGDESYLSTLVDIANLIKISEGYINIHEAEGLEFFEFMFYSDYFEQEFSKKQEKLDQDKQDMNNLIVDGISHIYKAMRG